LIHFALDYDNTATEDIELWKNFIEMCRARKHQVFIVTARYPNNIKDIEANFPDVEIIPCSGRYKNQVVQENALSIDIWIDDMPQIIMEETWQPTTPA
jgi:basic membrane lipoprotein Med (substrate-binding protein (PBP1-ABC) superfamily)